jgi:hypothetical protein
MSSRSKAKKAKTATPAEAAAAAASDTTAAPTQESTDSSGDPTDEAVLAYLKRKGMGNAALELRKILEDPKKAEEPSSREQMELDDAVLTNQRSVLGRTTGGGFGYDADSAPQIPQWGVPDSNELSDPSKPLAERIGADEARAYLDSFTALQLWVLSLPDDPAMLQPTVNPVEKVSTGISIASIAKNAAGGELPENVKKNAESLDNDRVMSWMPPSCKPELLAVTFALFVQTYCELLEVGMETTAKALLNTFRPVYEPLYAKELADVETCSTTEDIVRLNLYNQQHKESVDSLKTITFQMGNMQSRRNELARENSASAKKRIPEYDQNLMLMQQKYQEVAKQATIAFNKVKDYAFLRRARATRWQLTFSAASYATLAAFLSSQESLLPMSTMLQTKCELIIERRDPLPYTPACVLDVSTDENTAQEVQWAAPVPPAARLAEAGEDASVREAESLPFPKLHLDAEFDSKDEAEKAKEAVAFNRALLVNGFRRLEALERKREYEINGKKDSEQGGPALANPLKPSILLYTLCSSASSAPVLASGARIGSDAARSIWEEPGIGITCAKMCYPDGRCIATGCDDSAVRIWTMHDSNKKAEGVSESAMVLLGHKNGLPVFDVDWNRDGRTLLSAGGDGSVRLWDTMAVGPYGATTKVIARTGAPATKENTAKELEDMGVPGLRPESSADKSGAALAVYRGHSPSNPIWSVEFAPSGYYFATAAADATARIWTTDRPAPVRILSGHTSYSVNTVTWHPNCNYVLTGSDDKTVRMWDVQNGRCVRLLSGCASGINVVKVCPSGRYASAADYSGVVHMWDLGTGKKVNELLPPSSAKRDATGIVRLSSPTIHSLSYSACGTALATGGDDCVVRVWDVRGAANHTSGRNGRDTSRPGLKTPSQSFPTLRTSILDLQYTKRNLLMSVGKFMDAVPLVSPIENA